MKKTTNTTALIYQIKVTLRHITPPIWRRIQVTGDTKLGQLHDILQDVMGWSDSHLHAFRIGRDSYSEPNPEYNDGMKNERNVRLDKLACPPEDCSGPHGYMNLLDILNDPKHEEHEEISEWIGEGFDPEQFSVDDANEVLLG